MAGLTFVMKVSIKQDEDLRILFRGGVFHSLSSSIAHQRQKSVPCFLRPVPL